MSDYQNNTADKLAAAQEIEKYFKNLGTKSASNSGNKKFNRSAAPKSNIMNLTRMDMLGTSLIHLIPDSNKNYIRVIQQFYELYVRNPQFDKQTGAPRLDKDGKQIVYNFTKYVLDPSNFDQAGLTPDQAQLCAEVKTLTKEFYELSKISPKVNDLLGIKYRKEISLFYGYLNALIVGGQVKESGGVKVFKHNSANFSDNFVKATNAKTLSKGSPIWMSDWFSRDVGRNNKITSITTTLSTGYVTNFAFDESDRGVEITAADIAIANNIYSEFIDTTSFDTQYYVELRTLLQDKIGKAKALISTLSDSVDTTPQDAPQAVSANRVAPPTFQSQQMSNVGVVPPLPTTGNTQNLDSLPL
jgi:hypothetical protein